MYLTVGVEAVKLERRATSARSDPLSPVPGGEGWGEGPNVVRRDSRSFDVRPLTLPLSPEYGGEGNDARST